MTLSIRAAALDQSDCYSSVDTDQSTPHESGLRFFWFWIIGLPVQIYRKSYYTTPGICVGTGVGISGGVNVGKMLKRYVMGVKFISDNISKFYA